MESKEAKSMDNSKKKESRSSTLFQLAYTKLCIEVFS